MRPRTILPLLWILTGGLLVGAVLSGCGDDDEGSSNPPANATGTQPPATSDEPIVIGGIPDQSAATLDRLFGLTAEYLSKKTGLEVKYQPSVDYPAIVTAFRRGEVQLAWFGGLTGVQARAVTPGAQAIAQRPRDADFHSEFIVQADLEVDSLEDLKGLTFTFGSESSTSGHLMPRHFMLEAGVDADEDLQGLPNFSGSHDKTYALVEAGAFQAGALNEAVWESAVKDGKVDTSKVRVFYTTPAYYDYHWLVLGDLDETHGEGTTKKLTDALLALSSEPSSPEIDELRKLWASDGFIETKNENYQDIEDVAEQLGILR